MHKKPRSKKDISPSQEEIYQQTREKLSSISLPLYENNTPQSGRDTYSGIIGSKIPIKYEYQNRNNGTYPNKAVKLSSSKLLAKTRCRLFFA